MKDQFIYPTKKNMFLVFICIQLVPITHHFYYSGVNSLNIFLASQLIYIIAATLWKSKPDKEMDERELNVELKWKGKILDYTSSCLVIPICFLAFDPSISGWHIVMLSAVPSCFFLCLFTILMKRELGNLFYNSNSNVAQQ